MSCNDDGKEGKVRDVWILCVNYHTKKINAFCHSLTEPVLAEDLLLFTEQKLPQYVSDSIVHHELIDVDQRALIERHHYISFRQVYRTEVMDEKFTVLWRPRSLLYVYSHDPAYNPRDHFKGTPKSAEQEDKEQKDKEEEAMKSGLFKSKTASKPSPKSKGLPYEGQTSFSAPSSPGTAPMKRPSKRPRKTYAKAKPKVPPPDMPSFFDTTTEIPPPPVKRTRVNNPTKPTNPAVISRKTKTTKPPVDLPSFF